MEKDSLISIIVPVYKVQEYLDECVKSIVNQTYSNLEIILVDDGSPDACPLLCDNWAKRIGELKLFIKEMVVCPLLVMLGFILPLVITLVL